ncbi:MAG: hypothetical protein EAZ36_01670 [Verrucomicrobia bacterium]|nr:MAG: hypothetical protein EAZ36_01670 [Verrucomicrobiota bacterium]
MPAVPTLSELRQLMADRFPSSVRRVGSCVATGVGALDEALDGGLPTSTVTELVCAKPSSGAGVALASLLATTRVERHRIALLDGADGFAPDELPPEMLEHLVWVRCERGERPPLKTFWAAADLLVRDAHFSVVILDLRGLAQRDLLRTPVTTWYRLQRAIEQSATAALVLSPTALAPCASHRFVLADALGLEAMDTERTTLLGQLAPRHERQRAAPSLARLSA